MTVFDTLRIAYLAREHQAFIAWRASGYADTVAWAGMVYWYEAGMRLKLRDDLQRKKPS